MAQKKEKLLLARMIEAFFEGFIGTSRAAFWAMMVGFAIGAAIYLWFFRYDTLTGPAGQYLLKFRDDFEAQATLRALDLEKDPAEGPVLLILGTSYTATIFGPDRGMEERLNAATGEEWRVANMATPDQNPLEAMALIDRALANTGDVPIVVLFGAPVVQAGWPDEDIIQFYDAPRIGVRSEWADDEIVQLGHEAKPVTSLFVLDNFNFAALRAPRLFPRLLVRGPYRHLDYNRWNDYGVIPIEDRHEPDVAEEIRNMAAATDAATPQIYRSILARLGKFPRVEAIFMQEIPEPGIQERFGLADLIVAETAKYEAFTADVGADFWAPTIAPDFPQGAFVDTFHIGDAAAIDEIKNGLVQRVADLREAMNDD